uniref:IBR domain-containing protein n=1 Tax=Taenia asiatica TaxID=60517 RepID=A0A0R3W231_TAEAS
LWCLRLQTEIQPVQRCLNRSFRCECGSDWRRHTY